MINSFSGTVQLSLQVQAWLYCITPARDHCLVLLLQGCPDV